MKIFLFNDSRSQNNWGCRATTEALISLIEESENELIGTLEVEEISSIKLNRFSKKIKNFIKKFNYFYTFSRKIFWLTKKLRGPNASYLESMEDFERFSKRIFLNEVWQEYLPDLKTCDLVLVNGEGSIYSSEQKGFMTLFICWFAKNKLNKKCILVNHTADLSNKKMMKLAEEIYPILDDVSYRDPISDKKYNYLVKNEDTFVPDAAFIHKYVARNFFKSEDIDYQKFNVDLVQDDYICLLGSSILGRPENGGFFPLQEYRALTNRLIEEKYKIVIVSSDTTDDKPLCEIADDFKLPFFDASTSLKLGICVLANSRCIIGGRWHPSILGSLGGTPSIMMSANTSKTTALLQMFDLPERTFDPFTLSLSLDEIIFLLQDFISQGSNIRDSIKRKSLHFSEEAKKNIRFIESKY